MDTIGPLFSAALMLTTLCACDRSAGPVDLAAQALTVGPAKSGSRLRLRWVDGTDGSRAQVDVPVVDSALTRRAGQLVACSYRYRYQHNGHLYCLPVEPVAMYDHRQPLFSDSGCTQRVFFDAAAAACGPAPLYVVYEEAAAPCAPVFKVATVREVAPPSALYLMVGMTCAPGPGGSAGTRYFVADKAMALADFQEGTEGAE